MAHKDKTFSGKKFRYIHGYSSKAQAQDAASYMRKTGHSARIIKEGKFYNLYARSEPTKRWKL